MSRGSRRTSMDWCQRFSSEDVNESGGPYSPAAQLEQAARAAISQPPDSCIRAPDRLSFVNAAARSVPRQSIARPTRAAIAGQSTASSAREYRGRSAATRNRATARAAIQRCADAASVRLRLTQRSLPRRRAAPFGRAARDIQRSSAARPRAPAPEADRGARGCGKSASTHWWDPRPTSRPRAPRNSATSSRGHASSGRTTSPSRVQTRQPARSRVAQHAHQHRFHLVVARMRGGDHGRRVTTPRHVAQESLTRRAPFGLVRSGAPRRVRRRTGNPSGRPRAATRPRARRGGDAGAMIERRDRRTDSGAHAAQGVQQRHRVAPAGNRQNQIPAGRGATYRRFDPAVPSGRWGKSVAPLS